MKLKFVTFGGAALIALAGFITALTITQAADATGCKSKKPAHPELCNPQPPPPVPPPHPTPPPVNDDCDHSVMGGKDGQPGNDDCVPNVTPPPLVITTPPPSPPVVVVPPPPPLKCDKGMTEISRSATQIVCGKLIVKVRTKTHVKIKKVLVPKFPKVCVPKKHVPPVAG